MKAWLCSLVLVMASVVTPWVAARVVEPGIEGSCCGSCVCPCRPGVPGPDRGRCPCDSRPTRGDAGGSSAVATAGSRAEPRSRGLRTYPAVLLSSGKSAGTVHEPRGGVRAGACDGVVAPKRSVLCVWLT